ncbi:DUF4838 domain-containing protein [Reichenbachiella carrageenanivorans]|uniref:DUF4838 domain-containing protein n=1 Tax=Reichenbachiella carrageenanivorans TaxID=2979869 RepID=A0ABY6D763_9BACT|nr:DUF4838 domain-containing protein [Reichenbachiella carrageenanivorans]UXX80973.1 DUF4838 domain-containing protein [Reichenbachiella carrageenanivorans]
MKISIITSLIVSCWLISCNSEDMNPHMLVENGEAKAVIILPENTNTLQEEAIVDFVSTVKRATGVLIDTLSSERAQKRDGVTKIIFGPSALTEKLGIDTKGLQEEEFWIVPHGQYLIILAKDIIHETAPDNIWRSKEAENSRVTQWALGYLLDRYLGVRWLWPGELGTYVPQQNTVSLPDSIVQFQQPLVRRCFNVIEENKPNLTWLGYHQFAGERKDYHFQHSFRRGGDNGDWYEKYHQTHPEYLAKSPDGIVPPPPKRGFYHLCLSNPDVVSLIVEGWEKSGMPDYWDITPNDGNRFCTCDSCRALDETYGANSYTKEEIWKKPSHVSLTDRYVWFWNQIITAMRKKNPEVKVGVFLYSAYRNPPKKLKVKEGIVGEIVHGFDFSFWQEWQAVGVKEIGLRPNWLYMGASAPHLPLRKIGSYIEQARDNGMTLIDMDCFHEYWATQGPIYYLITRLIARPDLNTSAVLDEYCEAFGSASEQIRAYLDYWETYSEKVAFNIPAGGSLSQDDNGLYAQVSRQAFGQVMHPLKGHWKILPYIYNQEVLEPAYAILKGAQNKAANKEELARVNFLIHGLKMVEIDSEYMLSSTSKEKKERMSQLEQFGADMHEKYGYWQSKDAFFIKYWGLYDKAMDASEM